MSHFPALRVELTLIATTGDRVRSAGAGANIKAMFTKELEDALLDGRIDLAVHSLKDMAAHLPQGLALGAFPLREDPRDAWISKRGTAFRDLPSGARVATSAARRRAQLLNARPDLQLVPMRGNVDTRLRKLHESDLDGIVLALAGLKSLDRESAATELFSTDTMLPAVGQGCLGIEIREDDASARAIVAAIDHDETRQAVTAERAFLSAMGGDCRTPLAAYARCEGGAVTLEAAVFSLDGKIKLQRKVRGTIADAGALSVQLADALLADGARKVLNPS